MNRNDRKSPFALMTCAMLIFGTIGIFRRMIPLSSALLACWRGLVGAAFLLAVQGIRKHSLRFHVSKKQLAGLVVSGVLIGLNWILLFEAYHYTTIATATLCYYMQPTIVVLLSPVFFRERLTGKKLLCAAAAVAGMVLVSGVAEGGVPQWSELKGILMGLGAAVLYATVVIMNKRLTGIDPYEKTILQLASAAIALLPYLLCTEDFSAIQPEPAVIGCLLVVGLVHTGMAYAMYFGSMERLRAQTVAILSYIDPLTALLLSALLLHEAMTPLQIAGTVLILGATVCSELLPERRPKAQN